MTAAGAQIAGSQSAADAGRDWEAVRAAADIQYAPVPAPPPPETPDWLKSLGALLEWLLQPVARAIAWLWNGLAALFEGLGMPGPLVTALLGALAALMLVLIGWRAVPPLLRRLRRPEAPAPVLGWTPGCSAALALLEDADRLAAEGRFAEAAHLLLQRSVGHIAEARPDWLDPATTAREIAALPMLPPPARAAFGVIAARVERSLFALRALDAADWQAARAAYADFALARLAA